VEQRRCCAYCCRECYSSGPGERNRPSPPDAGRRDDYPVSLAPTMPLVEPVLAQVTRGWPAGTPAPEIAPRATTARISPPAPGPGKRTAWRDVLLSRGNREGIYGQRATIPAAMALGGLSVVLMAIAVIGGAGYTVIPGARRHASIMDARFVPSLTEHGGVITC
jgi:hypothetical protein